MKKLNMLVEERHIRSVYVQVINLLITTFGEDFKVKVGNLGKVAVDKTCGKKQISEAVTELQNLLETFHHELNGVESLVDHLVVEEYTKE